MARPSKPANIIAIENVSHRTKAEMKARTDAEKSALTGVSMSMSFVARDHKIAAKEFRRIKTLFTSIGKDDAIYESVINRYCLIYEECKDFEVKRESFYHNMLELEESKDELIDKDEMSLSSYYKMKYNMQKAIIDLDKQVQAKRKMLLDIEKENIMTIQSALRSIPKKPEEKQKSGMAAFMERRG